MVESGRMWYRHFKFHLLLWLLSGGLIHPLWAAPGFQNTAAGGGLALPSNPSSVFGNPAAVSQPRQASGETGVSGIARDNPVPWMSWLTPAGREASLGIGIQETNPGAIDQHQLEGTGVSRIFLGTWIGARATMQKMPEETNLDFSIGALHRLGPHLGIGWLAENVTESLDPSACNYCDVRQFGLGLSWFFDRNDRFSIFGDLSRFQRILGRYDSYRSNFGTKLEFGPNRNLQLIASAKRENWKRQSMLGFSGGITIQQYFLSTLVSASYAISELPIQHGNGSGPWHQFSIGLVWDAFQDNTDPSPFIRTTQAQISPGGVDNLPRGLDFLLRVSENTGKIGEWSLVIYTAPSHLKPEQLVRRYVGMGTPPGSVYWSGDDVAGYPCKAGIYAYRLIVSDMAGNRAWTEWQHIEIR